MPVLDSPHSDVTDGWRPPVPRGFCRAAAHANYEPMVEPWFGRIASQEMRFLKAGFPAEGMTDFLRRWVGAWNSQDLETLVACTTPDMEFLDSAAGHRHGHEAMREYTRAALVQIPDLAFYPQDDTVRSLPYWDFTDGVRRVTFPWVGVGRAVGPLTSPDGDFGVIPPLDAEIEWIGIDRYVLTDDWRIARIDCDWDVLDIMRQAGVLPSAGSRAMRIAIAAARPMAPLLRLRNRRRQA